MRTRRTAVAAIVAVVLLVAALVIIQLVDRADTSTTPAATSPAALPAPSSPVAASTTGPTQGPRTDQDRLGPVLLVPGYGGGRDTLLMLAARITATGREAQVLTLPGNGTGDLGEQMAVLDRAADAAVAAGAPSVDVIGFSAGGLVAGLWVARADGADQARRVISLGSPLHGTRLAADVSQSSTSCPPACVQMAPGSALLAELVTAGVGARVPWLSLWTARDEVVLPPDSARLPGAVNIEVQSICADSAVTHGGLPTDPLVAGLVMRALGAGPLAPATAADCAALRAGG